MLEGRFTGPDSVSLANEGRKGERKGEWKGGLKEVGKEWREG